MKRFVFAIIIGFSFSGMAHAQRTPPAPCGPAGDLSAELSTNVAADSRCFEIRMYTADPARDGVGDFERGIDELHQRFREKEVAIFEKHGAEIIAVWQNLDDPQTLIWMLAYRDPRPSARGLGRVRRRPGMDRAQTEVQCADQCQCFHDECHRLLGAQVVDGRITRRSAARLRRSSWGRMGARLKYRPRSESWPHRGFGRAGRWSACRWLHTITQRDEGDVDDS